MTRKETYAEKRKRQWREMWANPVSRWLWIGLGVVFVAVFIVDYRRSRISDEALAAAGITREEYEAIAASTPKMKTDEEYIAEGAARLCAATGEGC